MSSNMKLSLSPFVSRIFELLLIPQSSLHYFIHHPIFDKQLLQLISDYICSCGYMEQNQCYCMCQHNIHLYKEIYYKSLKPSLDGQYTNMVMTFGTMFGIPIQYWLWQKFNETSAIAQLKDIHHMTVLAHRSTNTQYQYFVLCRKSDHEHWLMFVYYPRFKFIIDYKYDLVIHYDSKVPIVYVNTHPDVTWAQLFSIYKHDIQIFLQTHYEFFFPDLYEGNPIDFKINQIKNKRWYRFLSQQPPSYFAMYRRSLMELMDAIDR